LSRCTVFLLNLDDFHRQSRRRASFREEE
jgi:hypothetical protein